MSLQALWWRSFFSCTKQLPQPPLPLWWGRTRGSDQPGWGAQGSDYPCSLLSCPHSAPGCPHKLPDLHLAFPLGSSSPFQEGSGQMDRWRTRSAPRRYPGGSRQRSSDGFLQGLSELFPSG